VLYTLTTAGTHPLTLPEVKQALKLSTTKDDDFLTLLMSTVLFYGERYSGRDFRPNVWTLLLDAFESRICLRKSEVATITSVKYYDQTSTPVQQTVASSVYYLKKSPTWSEILLPTDQVWPTDVDNLQTEHRIEIIFTTVVPPLYEDASKQALLKHITYLYQNRGDNETPENAVRISGAAMLYDQFRIARI